MGFLIFLLNLISNFITLLIISNLIFTINIIAAQLCENLLCFQPQLVYWRQVLLAGQCGTVNVYSFHLFTGFTRQADYLGARQGVIQRCRLSWLTNSDLLYESKCGGGVGEVAGSMSTAVYIKWHGAQINLGDLTPYLTCGARYGQKIWMCRDSLESLLTSVFGRVRFSSAYSLTRGELPRWQDMVTHTTLGLSPSSH